ncbi:MAG TPA: fructose 1,6-bisphosphatase [Candidatus Bathyarchaeota archaeon]|nr:fructose 1,6-bisphosphatase [Candidatus Bathyarchaeota archaeon]
MPKTTVSIIKADVGSIPGHVKVPRILLDMAERKMLHAKESGLINSYYVFNAGDDLELLMTHSRGESNEDIHRLAWETFMECAAKAKELKLYGAGQDLLVDAFSGNVKGMGPGVAEIEFQERGSDPLIVFAADKTEPSAFNYLMYRVFADPCNTSGLVIDPRMTCGFSFEVLDAKHSRSVVLRAPEELHSLLALIGTTERYMVKRVYRNSDNEVAASLSTTKLAYIAGKYVGKDDPVCLVRAQSGLPSVGEITSPLLHPYLVAGWMRGSHWGPLYPVALRHSQCTLFDGPPRLIGLGIQVSNGKLVEDDEGKPIVVDLFDDPAFDLARREALELAAHLRRQGIFQPARLSAEAMEYTTLPQCLKELESRFKEE